MENSQLQLLPPTFEPWTAKPGAKQIIVLMSGGVDSSVTAMLLKDAGWEVLGITMKIPTAEQCRAPNSCCGAQAGFVCDQLGIVHYFIDVERAFRKFVIEPFRRAYNSGATPSPCVDCNTHLKFTLVWDFLEQTFGISHLASGHYARLVQCSGRTCLARADDSARDQSYFLYGIPARRLSQLVLPLHGLTKQEVRQLAHDKGLDVAERPDSMELCFAGQGDYRKALGQEAVPQPGPILDSAGKVLGQHQGIFNYTLGQRRGLGIAFTEPRYVIAICPADNSVTLGTREEAQGRCVSMREVNVLLPGELELGQELFGQIRSPSKASPCTITGLGPQISVEFAQSQFAPCPGQRLVLYNSCQNVVAGGIITHEDSPATC